MSAMGKDDLRAALNDQLCLHNAFDTYAGLERLRLLDYSVFPTYLDHRLAAASWFVDMIPSKDLRTSDHHSVLLAALNAMDRYVATCTSEAKLRAVLLNVGNVRAACVSLSMKMYTVSTLIDLREMSARTRAWPKSAAGDATLVERSYRDPSAPGILAAEKDILVTLKGAVFPVHEENFVHLLVRYLLLNRADREAQVEQDILETATAHAVDTLSKMALDAGLLVSVPTWKRLAFCSLHGCQQAIVSSHEHEERGLTENDTVAVFEELRPGHLTQNGLDELKAALLAVDCPVCTRVLRLESRVAQSLRKVTVKICSSCRKRRMVETRLLQTRRGRSPESQRSHGTGSDETERCAPPPLGDDMTLDSLYCYESLDDSPLCVADLYCYESLDNSPLCVADLF